MLTFTEQKDIEKGLDYLRDVQAALGEAISHYADQEKLNDWNNRWYCNAKDSYETKLEEVTKIVIQLEARSASLPTTPVANKV